MILVLVYQPPFSVLPIPASELPIPASELPIPASELLIPAFRVTNPYFQRYQSRLSTLPIPTFSVTNQCFLLAIPVLGVSDGRIRILITLIKDKQGDYLLCMETLMCLLSGSVADAEL